MKERQHMKEPKKNALKDNKEHPQRGSAFNEKPGGQPTHSRTGVEKTSDPSENQQEPPGVPGLDEKKDRPLI